MTRTKRPDFCEDEHLCYLDDLRDSGITNMYGARPYLMEAFTMEEKEAKEVLLYWMESFGKDER